MSTKNECQELQNIKYRTMLLNSNKKMFTNIKEDISDLDILLDNECTLNKKEGWNKLDKSIKMDKINEYIELLTIKHKLTYDEKESLQTYLSMSLDNKKLYKNKEVTYIKETGKLDNIPILYFNNNTRKFSLKKTQVQSTTKSLGPTRKNNRSKSTQNITEVPDNSKSIKSKLSKSPKTLKKKV